MTELTKQDIREQARKHRETLRPDIDDAEKAKDLFFEAIAPKQDEIISLYWPKKDEFSTQIILEELLDRSFKCALPVVQENERALKFALWSRGDGLKESAFKVHEPIVTDQTEWVEPDILIVPLIAFDRQGNRVGYGRGHYDATLTELKKKKDVLAVGIAFSEQLVLFSLPAEEHDIPLDLVITPQKVYRFSP